VSIRGLIPYKKEKRVYVSKSARKHERKKIFRMIRIARNKAVEETPVPEKKPEREMQ
jgi:hypothetical protein